MFYAVHAVIPPKHKKRLQGFTEAFPLICPIPARAIQQIHKPTIHRLHHAWGIPSNAAPPAHTRYRHHARTLYRSAQPQTIPARRGQLLPCVDRWQVLTRCQQYRPGAPADWSASPPVQGQPGGGFDASSARRLAIWHWVNSQGAPGQPGTLHPAGQYSGRGAAGGAEQLAALAAALFRLSPDS